MPEKHNNSTARGYDRRWRKLRLRVLRDEPLCRFCKQQGRTTLAQVVDHIVPKREGGTDARENLQPLCAPCHDSIKAAMEKGGVVRGCDINGLPLDPGHHWNQ